MDGGDSRRYKPRRRLRLMQEFGTTSIRHHSMWQIVGNPSKWERPMDLEARTAPDDDDDVLGNQGTFGSSANYPDFVSVYWYSRGRSFSVRFGLFSESTGIKIFSQFLFTFANDHCVTWRIPRERLDSTVDDYLLHAWFNMTPRYNGNIPFGPEEPRHEQWLASNIADLFAGVIGGNRESSMLTDVTLIAKKPGSVERRFYCHRILLASRSPVFKSMFTYEMNEASSGMVEIEDIDGETMEMVLEYIYTSKTSGYPKDAIPDLIYAAEKYDMIELRDECAFNLILEPCDDDERIEHLRLAEFFRIDWWKNVCIVILSNGDLDMIDLESIREYVSDETMEKLIEARAEWT